MENRGVDALVVSPSSDLVYLCGYDALALERPTLLVLCDGRDPVLVVPRLERARVPEVSASVAEVISWEETEDPFAVAAAQLEGARSVVIGDQMWASHLVDLLEALGRAPGAGGRPPGDTDIRKASEVLGPVRARKEPAELEALEVAARMADAVASRLTELVEVGMSERDAASAIASALLEEGNDGVGFVIVASGPNSASPHHEPGNRRIADGDVVVCDFGGIADGYRSDITRTMVFGEPPEGFESAYAILREAQQRGVEVSAAGASAGEIDRAVRRVIEEAGYGPYFIHRTGHGIGLDPHEPPYIVGGSQERIDESMCFSVEPGIYIEGRFGMRLEDIVVATKTGGRRLNQVPGEVIRV